MNRERTAWLLSFLLLALATFRNPTSAQRDDDYLFVRTLVDIHRQVRGNYVEPVDQEKLEQAAIDGMLDQLDPFTTYVPPAQRESFDRLLEGTFKGVGIQINQTEKGEVEVVSPIDGSPAFKAGVLPGDVILKVNGESIEGLRLPDVIRKIGGELGASVELTVRHLDGSQETLKMRREEIVMPTVSGFERATDNRWNFYVSKDPKIAYIRMSQFTPSSYDTIKGILTDLLNDGMKGLILDLRWNPGGQLDQAVQLVDLFLADGTIVSTKGARRPEKIERAVEPGTLPWFPMIVLVNEHSASASEIVAGSLLDNRRAAVLGERTYGKGSVQELIPLEGNNGELKLTVAYYYLPSGRLVHRKKGAETWGVEPQIHVAMDEKIQQLVVRDYRRSELFRRPTTNPSTQTTSPQTQPATQPIDVQLQRAVDTMVLMTVLQGNPQQGPPPGGARPTTRQVAREGE